MTTDEFFRALECENPLDEGRLYPELQAFMDDGPLGRCLKHPLVFQVPIFYSWEWANRQFDEIMKIYAERLHAHDFHGAFVFVHKPYKLIYLNIWYQDHLISVDQLRELLQENWNGIEFPGQNKLTARKLFKEVGFITDVPGGVELPDSFTVFRGCRPKYRNGLSWTRSAATAAKFASRFNQGGSVYSTVVTRNMVLGVFNSRGEQEVVLDYRMLTDVKLVDSRVTNKGWSD